MLILLIKMIFTLGVIHNEGDGLTFMNQEFHKFMIAFIIMLPSNCFL